MEEEHNRIVQALKELKDQIKILNDQGVNSKKRMEQCEATIFTVTFPQIMVHQDLIKKVEYCQAQRKQHYCCSSKV